MVDIASETGTESWRRGLKAGLVWGVLIPAISLILSMSTDKFLIVSSLLGLVAFLPALVFAMTFQPLAQGLYNSLGRWQTILLAYAINIVGWMLIGAALYMLKDFAHKAKGK